MPMDLERKKKGREIDEMSMLYGTGYAHELW
jgi:hypothetical protein